MSMSNTSNGATVIRHHPTSKGTIVFIIFALLAILILTSAVAVFVDVKKDGYRQVPERNLVRIF